MPFRRSEDVYKRQVARAGAGVNNIPIADYSDKGIVVFNTPGANANGVKEMVIAGMLLASRDLIGGNKWVEENKEDPNITKAMEKAKKAFAGREIQNKKIGVIGLGAVSYTHLDVYKRQGKGSVSGDKLAVPNSSYFGVIDTAGFEKDSFYFYTSQWREDKQTLHIVPQSWNKKDLSISGGNVPVYVYSNAAKVELYLNGKLIGTSTRNPIKTAAGHEWATYSNESNDEEQCVAVNESPEWKAQAIQFKVKYAEGTLCLLYTSSGNKEWKRIYRT